MNSNDRKVAFSSGNDEYETPKWLYDILDEVFDFTLDPCSTDENHLAPKWFTQERDGLKQSWSWNRVFVNYPYSQAKKWLAKIGEESTTSDIVVLCPARTDTKGFQEHVFPKATAVTFLNGRLQFLDGGSPKITVFKELFDNWKMANLAASGRQNLVNNILQHKYSDLTGEKWTGKFPTLDNIDAANDMFISGYDSTYCARELMESITTSAPFPSCIIFYCDEDKVDAVKEKLDGHTVYLKNRTKNKIVLASLGGGFTSSAQMPRILLERYGKENVRFINCVLPNEHPDTWRLFDAVEEKLGIRITHIAYHPDRKWQYVEKEDRTNSDRLLTPFDIFDEQGFIGNSRNDPCSRMLKRETVFNYVSDMYKKEDIVIAVGIHGDEFERRAAIEENWKRQGYDTVFPIIEEPYLEREEQIRLMNEWYGVSLELYEYGFDHNNCGGACVKAGQRQWALLWYYRPDVYDEWEQREIKWNEEWAEKRGKEYTILRITRDKKKQYISLKDFREQILEPAYRGETETFLSKFIQSLVPNPGCMWCSAI